ncbi:microtubule associated protein-domain-containing protein [Umbelopsis sp. AD052]|nr:microtubule associated protein-domain-containing protein [Umbelopsis sp. AD052]
MDMDELLTYIVSHCEKISLIYEEIGTSEKARRENTQSLFESFVHIMNQQTKTITEERESLKRKCHDALSNIARYKRLMGTYVDEDVLENPKQPLLTWLSELCDKEEIYQRKYEAKLDGLRGLHNHINDLREALVDFVECEPIDDEDADVSELAIQHIEQEIDRCEAEYDRRATLVKDLNRKIQEHWNTLGVTAKDDLDQTLRKLWALNNDDDEDTENMLLIPLVSPAKLEEIAQKLESLTEFRSEREFRVDELLHQIMKIWDLLSIDEATREVFKDENYGLREENVKKLENELQRLTVIKQERMEEFIRRARQELEMLWDQLYYSDEQRQKFKPAYTESIADEILESHEKEITRTHILIEDQKHILERVEKHMRLVEEIKQFEASMSDPNRLFGKGQRDPGRLLREEKFRRRMARELPKVKRELRSALQEYAETNGEAFCVFGKPYTETIDEQEEQEQAKPARSTRGTKRASSEVLDTPKRGGEKRITKTPSTTPRNRPKTQFSTPHRHPTAHMESTPSNRRKRIRSHLEEAGLNDASDSILHKVREHNLKSALQPVNDNQLPPYSPKVPEVFKGVARAGSPTLKERVVWSDEDIDEGIFDDGPDLSDLEN